MRTRQVLVVDQAGTPAKGATQILTEVLISTSDDDVSVAAVEDHQIADEIRSSDAESQALIFCQQEGLLSPSYRKWASGCLDAGAQIVELNVFNLPSPFRPSSDAYQMAVYTQEGAMRYRLRSVGAHWASQPSFLTLPNILRAAGDRAKRSDASRAVRFLRVGRPDPIKWSNWEIDFCIELAAVRPDTSLELTLVGAPASLSVPKGLPANLSIEVTEYSAEVADFYGSHDVYLHYSRIGETFGNTLAEAQNAGLLVVASMNPRWDCAPAEYLDRRVALVGTPRWLKRHTPDVWIRIDGHLSRSADPHPKDPGLTGQEYLARLTNRGDGAAQPTPSVAHALWGLSTSSRTIRGVPTGLLAPLWEVGRGFLLRIRLQSSEGEND